MFGLLYIGLVSWLSVLNIWLAVYRSSFLAIFLLAPWALFVLKRVKGLSHIVAEMLDQGS